MASERFRGPIEQVVRALRKCGGRAQHNAEFLQLELSKDDRALVRWLSSPFGVAVWSEALGAIHERLETDPRNTVLAAGARVADDVEAHVRAEVREVLREKRNATPPPASAQAHQARPPVAMRTGIRREEAARVLPEAEVIRLYSEPAPKGAA